MGPPIVLLVLLRKPSQTLCANCFKMFKPIKKQDFFSKTSFHSQFWFFHNWFPKEL
jgi:hypothetical protein